MLFNSFEFAIFLPLVFLIYWLVLDYALKRYARQLQWQNLFVVAVSYIFYGWWDWRFLSLIILTSFLSWLSGLKIQSATSHWRKAWLTANIVINLFILMTFKYFNFFVESFCNLLHIQSSLTIQIILPVGISFYTFQALSYSIDVYRKKLQPTNDIIAFFAYVAFFPQLVAGPIERATNLLPQFEHKRIFDYTQASDGMRLILWGLFKKIVVADNCASYVDQVFANPSIYNASTLWIAAILFTFQIYGDFSGYSDIAIGTAKLFGIQLMRNFNNPLFSRDVAEFWRRWHISLTTWFRDYVYIPLGGSRVSTPLIIRNTFIIFLLSGFWHGANWTYLAWGAYHALLFIPLILWHKNRRFMDTPTLRDWPRIIGVFLLCVVGWIIFRSSSIEAAWCYICGLVSDYQMPELFNKSVFVTIWGAIVLMLSIEWKHRYREHGLDIQHYAPLVKWCFYSGILAIILIFGGHSNNFIYFQF